MGQMGKVWVGVDTHKDAHVVCVLDASGCKIAEGRFEASARGYAQIAKLIGDAKGCSAVGIEGTSSYGAGLYRYLDERGYSILEALTPHRRPRGKGTAKNDSIDAERAARDAMAGNCTVIPKSQRGWVEAARCLIVARRAAIKTRTSCASSIRRLIDTADDGIRARYSHASIKEICDKVRVDDAEEGIVAEGTYEALRSLAFLWRSSSEEADRIEEAIAELVRDNAPALLDMEGCGALCAATLAVAAGDNPERIVDDAAFASLCGAAPLEASSGKVVRHRLNRGGNRQANCALHKMAIQRMRFDDRTKAYVDRRLAQGKTRREIIRCLKRYLCREVLRALKDPHAVSEDDGKALKQRRMRLGLTQREIEAHAGFGKGVASRIENGSCTNKMKREAYALALSALGRRAS